ncbi:DUF6292 family protein [Actinoplanes sp. L3-i22]|uniref:DUF6292 family protein n=1 Tax=Actinoplanes sp. L3-i22 TaxID=2836373 RepID=UPI001C789543|nr:DUF6292 family protein [Actinoplanes sp. L3-i22]BCY13587.1 hypothetical protein L3i22_086750 [Actinoplanes sp. L3-i22]
MDDNLTPSAHPHPWLDMLRPYITDTVHGLAAAGYHVQDSWLDPRDPRDATIRLAGGTALVWDEETGWRRGRFVSGAPGRRTELDGVEWLAGGLVPDPRGVAHLGGHARAPRYRGWRDVRDGLDDHLRR